MSMWSTIIFLLGFGIASVVADTSEYLEVARNAIADEREEARAARAEDADGSTAGFDSQLQAATGELKGIMSGMSKSTLPRVASSPTRSSGDSVELGDSNDFAPEDAMGLHLAQLQTKVQASNGISQKLRGGVLDRDREIHQAEGLMRKELAAIQKTLSEQSKATTMEAQLEAEQSSLQNHINAAKQNFQTTESQARDEEVKRVSSGTETAKLRNDLKVANEEEAADEKKLAEFKEQSAADDAKDASEIEKLQAIITAKQSQVAGGIATHVRWEKNATALAQKLQEEKGTLRSMLLAKQSSDVDLSQVVSRWKDSLAQLRNQVKVNADLRSRAQQDSQSMVDHLQDLKLQIKDRDTRIGQLKQRLQQH